MFKSADCMPVTSILCDAANFGAMGLIWAIEPCWVTFDSTVDVAEDAGARASTGFTSSITSARSAGRSAMNGRKSDKFLKYSLDVDQVHVAPVGSAGL